MKGRQRRYFISAVTGQFKACRDAVASDLRACGCEVKVQEDFTQGSGTLIERLEEYVAQCDRVIALVGDACGSLAQADGLLEGKPARSYTQWEYHFARGERLDGTRAVPKDLFVYFASGSYLEANPVTQTAEQARLQEAFAADVKASGKHRAEFDSLDGLCRLMLRDGFSFRKLTPKPNNLPYTTLGTLFKGRDEFLARLRGALSGEGTAAAIVTRQAVYGLGGVGKTRLAVEYGLRHEADYDALLFVVADTPEALRRNLATLCGPLVLNLPEQHAREESVQVSAAIRWLRDHPNWFLIIDNVDTESAAAEVEKLVAALSHGHVVITGRQSNWSAGVTPLDLYVLGQEDAAAFLLEGTAGRRRATPTDDAEARALARELDGLALALEQARAYIGTLRVSFAEYRRRWTASIEKVSKWHDERLMNCRQSVAVTWDTTIQQLSPGGRALLHVLACLAPEALPRDVVESEAGAKALADGVKLLTGEAPLDPDPVLALADLAAYSMVKWEDGNGAFKVHRLVQGMTRASVAEQARDGWTLAALAVVEGYLPADPLPGDVRSWPRWVVMRPHVEAVLGHVRGRAFEPGATGLMNDLGAYLHARCEWSQAEPLMRRALAIDDASFGKDHPAVARDLNNLAQLLQATNRLGEAEPMMRRALAIDDASFGKDHPEVATDLSNLAQLLKATNRLGEAEPLMRRALAIDEASFGKDHPVVARDLNNLAQLLQATNGLAEAEPLMRRALAIDEASFGKDHPAVATDLNNLAGLLKATNRLTEAEPPSRRHLEIFLKFTHETGHEHQHLRAAANNHAVILAAMGRSEAEVTAALNEIMRPFGMSVGGQGA
jgi:tetratricopeptide (TPR) repeat protein